MQEKLGQIGVDLRSIFEKNQKVEQNLNQAYTCENPKLLEIVMEHIMFHWDDIQELLFDELIEEEVLERNAVEMKIINHDK